MRRLPGLWLAAFFLLLLTGCNSTQRRLERALELEQRLNYGAALAEYQALLQPEPKDASLAAELHLRMGECLWRLDRGNEAVRALRRAVELDSRNFNAHVRLGELYLVAGAFDRAAEQAVDALTLKAENAEALTVLGAAYLGQGHPRLAAEFYERALRAEPQRVNVAVALAELYNQERRPAEARVALLRASAASPASATPRLALARLEEQQGNIPAAEELYRAAMAAEDTPETNLRLAQFLLRQMRVKEAEAALRRADQRFVRQGPGAVDEFDLLSGRAHDVLARFREQLKQGRGSREEQAARAARLVEAALLLDGSDPQSVQRARLLLDDVRKQLDPVTIGILEAEIALAGGDLAVAEIRASGALAAAPQSPAARYVMGLVRYRGGDLPTAAAEWQAALDLNERFQPARLALARLELEYGGLKAAEEQVAAVVRDEPANLDALGLYARVLAAQRRFDDARIIAYRARSLDGDSTAPRVLLGEIALAQQRAGEALVHFQQALLLDSRSEAALRGLTRVYRSGRIDRTLLLQMEALADREPRSPALLELVGRLYAERRLHRDAVRALQRALEMEPGRAGAAAALARIYAAQGKVGAAAESAQESGGGAGALLAALRAQRAADLPQAIAQYEVAVRQGDPSGVAANNLAWLYAQHGRNLDRALALAQAARERAPNNPAFFDTLGYVLLKRREYTQAVGVMENAVLLAAREKSPLLSQLRARLEEAYRLAGQPREAAQLLRQD